MAEPDFDITRTIIPHTVVSNNRAGRSFVVEEGSHCAIVLLNATTNLPAIQALLNDIKLLCDKYVQLDWVAEALPGHAPGVKVEVTVRDDELIVE